MKTKRKLFFTIAIVVLGFTACNKTTDDPIDNSIEGTYAGTLTNEGLKSGIGEPGSTSATAEVTKAGDGQIEVHCYSDELDTTFMLNYFDNHDSVMVCLTGDDFEHMYGHMYGQGHMGGGMMGDITDGETEWQHHMDDEHQDGDEHFGGFDMDDHTFSYTFRMMNGENPYELHFQGSKSN